jgi:hypothetical protein
MWKRVYAYACALFDSLFGSAPLESREVLSSHLVSIIADYAFDFSNRQEFLYIEQERDVWSTTWSVCFKVTHLTRELMALHLFWQICSQPALLDKIKTLFLTTFEISKGQYDRGCSAHMGKFYNELGKLSASEAVNFFIFCHKMDQNEAQEAAKFWRELKTIDCLAEALQVYDERNDPRRVYEEVAECTREVVWKDRYKS